MYHDSNCYCKSTYGIFISCIVPEFLSSFLHCSFQKIIISFCRGLGDGGQWYLIDLYLHSKGLMPVAL